MKLWRKALILVACLLLGTVALGWGLVGPGLGFTLGLKGAEVAGGPEPFGVDLRKVGPRGFSMALYRPAGRWSRVVLLAHGVHGDGFREARLTRYARELARRGYLVAVPDLEDLKQYEIVPRVVDDLEAATLALLAEPEVASRGARPVLHGISFSGGLAFCAATRPSLKGRLGGIFAFGGHGDLGRVLQYLASGDLPGGGTLAPHLYGQAVVARMLAAHLVPPDQVEPLRAALFLFLREQPEAFRKAVEALPPEAKALGELCVKWDAQGMAARLRPLALTLRGDSTLSPLRGPVPDCPLFLLHGSVDNVIPPTETLALAAWASHATPTNALVTDLIRHVELEDKGTGRPGLVEQWRLLRLMTQVLRS